MAVAFAIEPDSGALLFGAARVVPWQSRLLIHARLAGLVLFSASHRDGSDWLDIPGLAFGGFGAQVSLGLADDRLERCTLVVDIPPSSGDGAWPSDVDVDAELGTVRHRLDRMIGFDAPDGVKAFPWGEVWSRVAPGQRLPTHGLRYWPRPTRPSHDPGVRLSSASGVRHCPFCDSLELRIVVQDGRAVACNACGAKGPNMSDADAAWAAWTRGVLFSHPPADTMADRQGAIYKLPRPD